MGRFELAERLRSGKNADNGRVNHPSELVIITYHDRPRFVLMSMAEYDRLRERNRKVGMVTELPEGIVQKIEGFADMEDSSERISKLRERGLLSKMSPEEQLAYLEKRASNGRNVKFLEILAKAGTTNEISPSDEISEDWAQKVGHGNSGDDQAK